MLFYMVSQGMGHIPLLNTILGSFPNHCLLVVNLSHLLIDTL